MDFINKSRFFTGAAFVCNFPLYGQGSTCPCASPKRNSQSPSTTILVIVEKNIIFDHRRKASQLKHPPYKHKLF